jgi:hypothetical protein
MFKVDFRHLVLFQRNDFNNQEAIMRFQNPIYEIFLLVNNFQFL